MSLLTELISILLPAERGYVQSYLGDDHTVCALIIRAHLQNTPEDQIGSHLGITKGTYSKTQTLAYNTVVAALAANVNTPYDRIQLVRTFLARGLRSHSLRLYQKLETEFEKRKEYRILDILYREGIRLCNTTGDVALMSRIAARMKLNSGRVTAFNELDADISLLALTLVHSKGKLTALQIRQVSHALKRARSLDHALLLQNALTCRYAVAVSCQVDYDTAHELAVEIAGNADLYGDVLTEYGVAVSYQTYIHFISQYNYQGDPGRRIGTVAGFFERYGGPFEKTLLTFNAFSFYFYTGHTQQAEAFADKLEGYAATSYRFAPLECVARALLAYKSGDYKQLRSLRSSFYQNPSHADYADHDLVLRILDILAYLRKEDVAAAESSAESLRKYTYRRLSVVSQEYTAAMRLCINLVATLAQVLPGAKQRNSLRRQLSDKKFYLRSTDFIYREMQSVGLKIM